MEKDLLFSVASIDIEAAAGEKKPATVSMLAYSGGVIQVGYYGSTVVDLAGLEMPASIPLLSDHSAQRRDVLGHGEPKKSAGKLTITGVLSAANQAAREIAESSAAGFPWQASIGVQVLNRKYLRAGEKVSANGRTFVAPADGLTLVIQGRLKEVSVVAIGADADTSVSIAAKSGAPNMGKELEDDNTPITTTDPIMAERSRVSTLLALADRHSDILPTEEMITLRASIVNGELDEAGLSKKLLAAVRDARPRAPLPHLGGGPTVDNRDALTAAFLLHCGRVDIAKADYSEHVLHAAERLHGRTMLDTFANALRAEGQEVPRGANALLKAAFSTASLPNAIGSTAEKIVFAALQSAPNSWRAFCRIISLSNFKVAKSLRLLHSTDLEEVAADGEIKSGSLDESSFDDIQLRTFGKNIAVTRKMLIDDDAGVLTDLAESLGRAAARAIADAVYEVLLANADDHFGVGNGNYLSGAATALGFDALTTAIQTLTTQTDADGNVLDIVPATLLVPTSLETVARQLLTSTSVARYTSDSLDNLPEGNPFARQGLQLVVEPRLQASKFTGYSESAWYLLGPASTGPMLAAFLNGRQQPVIEQADAAFNQLGTQWRVYWDYAASFGDPATAILSAGV